MNAEPLKVFIAYRESKCGECGRELGHHSWITLAQAEEECLADALAEILAKWQQPSRGLSRA